MCNKLLIFRIFCKRTQENYPQHYPNCFDRAQVGTRAKVDGEARAAPVTVPLAVMKFHPPLLGVNA